MFGEVKVMIPGPTPVVSSIREAIGREVQAFGDPRFVSDYKSLIDDLSDVFGCDGQAFPLAGSGTLGMEMTIANSTRPGDRILLVSHGYFGDRFIDICERKGRQVDVLASKWGEAVPLESIEEKLKEHAYALVAVTHVDTSTGVRCDIEAVGNIVSRYPDTLFLVDGVASTAGEYEHMREMRIDLLLTGSQKAFGVSPGMFIVWANKRALARRESLGKISEYYVDFDKWLPIMENPAKYFATPPVNLVWAMRESLNIIQKEGLRARADRHEHMARALQAAFESMGLTIVADAEHRAVTLSAILYPEGIDDQAFRGRLFEEGVVVAGTLGPIAGKGFRVGHMGNVDALDYVYVLSAIERALRAQNVMVEYGASTRLYLELLDN